MGAAGDWIYQGRVSLDLSKQMVDLDGGYYAGLRLCRCGPCGCNADHFASPYFLRQAVRDEHRRITRCHPRGQSDQIQYYGVDGVVGPARAEVLWSYDRNNRGREKNIIECCLKRVRAPVVIFFAVFFCWLVFETFGGFRQPYCDQSMASVGF